MLEHGANVNTKKRMDWLHLVWYRKVGLQKLYATLSSTVPILVTTTTIEPGEKVVDLYLHLIY
jgi:hypothetical protein